MNTYTPMDETEAEFLAAYDPSKFPIITNTVDLALFAPTTTQGVFLTLLIQRGNYPYKNCWALPGGFINAHERVLDAAVREAEEETGVLVASSAVRFLSPADAPDRDPRGRCISFLHTVKLPSPLKAEGRDDAKDAQWFPLDFALELPLAFDHKDLLIEAAQYWGLTTSRTWDDNDIGDKEF